MTQLLNIIHRPLSSFMRQLLSLSTHRDTCIYSRITSWLTKLIGPSAVSQGWLSSMSSPLQWCDLWMIWGMWVTVSAKVTLPFFKWYFPLSAGSLLRDDITSIFIYIEPIHNIGCLMTTYKASLRRTLNCRDPTFPHEPQWQGKNLLLRVQKPQADPYFAGGRSNLPWLVELMERDGGLGRASRTQRERVRKTEKELGDSNNTRSVDWWYRVVP